MDTVSMNNPVLTHLELVFIHLLKLRLFFTLPSGVANPSIFITATLKRLRLICFQE